MDAPERIAQGTWRVPLRSRTMPPFEHTNSYLIADRGVGVLIDAGSDDPTSVTILQKLLQQAEVRLLKAVLLTHTHPDHCAGLALIQAHFSEPIIYVHPLELARLEQPGLKALEDGRTLMVGDRTVQALHTPGHSPGHLSYYLHDTRTLLAGDLVAGQGSTWVGVPEGDVTLYLKSLERLGELELGAIGPGHGPVLLEPYTKLMEAREHRLAREAQIVTALQSGSLTLAQLRHAVYPALHEALQDLADRSLLAHLKKLMNEMRILHLGADEAGPYARRT